MQTCTQCHATNLPANAPYCPMCGSPVAPQAAAAPPNFAAGSLSQMLVNAAASFIQSRVEQKLAPVSQIVNQLTGGPAGPPVPSTPPPAWYEAAYREGQPKMDPSEVARRQAIAQARAREAAQMMNMAMKSQHDSIMSILGNMKS
jgi:hypothetical protein